MDGDIIKEHFLKEKETLVNCRQHWVVTLSDFRNNSEISFRILHSLSQSLVIVEKCLLG